MNLDYLKNNCLVFDIETYAEYPDGKEISIKTNFDDYISYAKCKWFGCYSYKHDEEYYLDVSKDYPKIKKLLEEHSILVGFNSEEFDFPILLNNGLIDPYAKYLQVDCMKILGSSTFKDKKGFKYKGRGNLMNYKFKNNSLAMMATEMELEFQKGSIDYMTFKKDIWTLEERKGIIRYLMNDVLATKQMFDKLWDYWKPFTSMLYPQNIRDLSWIRSSIASVIYKSVCFAMNIEPTYAEGGVKEEMGGRVLDPKYEEANDVWYIDFTSLYPHIYCMFNLFAETSETNGKNIWHGNDIFKVKGYYNVSHLHPLSEVVQQKIKERIALKDADKNNPMIYTLKIWLNGLYGVNRSPIFEKVHTPNSGYDCCWLGQQIQILTEKMMDEFGFESIYGDTDSLMVIAKKEEYNNLKYVNECLKKVVQKILDNVPFPSETYNIDFEDFLLYVMFPFSDQPIVDQETGKNIKKGNRLVKERKGKKKNYLYIYENDEDKLDIKLVGLPLMKDNATPLGMKIYKEILKPKILEDKRAKFTKEFIDNRINEYLKDKEIMKLLAVEYKVKPSHTYKTETGIHAQISKHYFNGDEGLAYLIKNKKLGEVGKGRKYCTLEEAFENKLTIEDLDLEKIYNELDPFILVEDLTKV